MGFRINTNIGAMNAHMNASQNNLAIDKNLNALSSGLRINKAADDASGLSIANKLSAQSQGLGQAISNSNDAVGLMQTADGALQEYGDILKRVRVLATQAANDTQDTDSRAYISLEITGLMEEANDISDKTAFNGIQILSGQDGGDSNSGIFVFHTGAYATDTQTLKIGETNTSTMLEGGSVSVTTQSNAENTISVMDTGIRNIDKLRATIGAAQNKIESNTRNISVTQVNVASAESQIRDVDFASESASLSKHNILAQSGSYAMSQANSVQQNVTRLLQ